MKYLLSSLLALSILTQSFASIDRPMPPESCWDKTKKARVVDGSFIFMVDTPKLSKKRLVTFLEKLNNQVHFESENLHINADYVMQIVSANLDSGKTRQEMIQETNAYIHELLEEFPEAEVSCNSVVGPMPGVSVGN